jgi:endonuclease YncB( thermonuclease family)
MNARIFLPPLLLTLSLGSGGFAQTPARSLLGTVTGVRSNANEIEVKPETGDSVTVKVNGSTSVKKVAPGQTDLSKAETATVADVAAGDRVLVTLGPDAAVAVRVVVMPATDLAKRDAADRLDWQRRGVAGVVTAISGNDISVEMRSLGAPAKYTVTAGARASFKRYAPDSVRFADAKTSSLGELSVGDQTRARGQKSADGLKVDADEVVFGTFLSKAGTITAVNAADREITLKDLSNKKPLVVKFTADSQVKRMPDMGALPGGGRGAAGPGRGGADIGQILEGLPRLPVEDLKQGEVVVVSASRGARPDQITAITLLANAETLVQLAMAARGAGATGPAPSLAGLASSISNVGP